MSAMLDAFKSLMGLVLDAQDVFLQVSVGTLPAEDSLCMALSAGGESSVSLDLRGDLSMDIVVNDKHKDQTKAIDALADIHHNITAIKNLPTGDGWQILSISTSSAPTFIEFDGDQWLYGSGLDVHIYIE